MIAIPPSHGPSALAALNAAWWEAAASVCASRATSIRCDCSTGPSAPIVATASTSGSTAQADCAASGNSRRMSIDQTSTMAAARKPKRSNSQPPARVPRMLPMPNAISANGMKPSLTPVTCNKVGVR